MRKILLSLLVGLPLLAFEYADCCGEIADVYLFQKEMPKPPVKTLETNIRYYAMDNEISEPVLEKTDKTREVSTKE